MLSNKEHNMYIENYYKLENRKASNFVLKILLIEKLFELGVKKIRNKVNLNFLEESRPVFSEDDYAQYLLDPPESFFSIKNSTNTDIKSHSIDKILHKIEQIDTNFFLDVQANDNHKNRNNLRLYMENDTQTREYLLSQCRLFLMPKVLYLKTRFKYYKKGAKHFIGNSTLPEFKKFISCIEKQNKFHFSEVDIAGNNYKILPDNLKAKTYDFFIHAANLYHAQKDMAEMYFSNLVKFYHYTLNESIKITVDNPDYYLLRYKYEDNSIIARLYTKDNNVKNILTLPFDTHFIEKELLYTIFNHQKFEITDILINNNLLIDMLITQNIDALTKKIENMLNFLTFNYDSPERNISVNAKTIAEELIISTHKKIINSTLTLKDQQLKKEIKRL